MNSQQYSVRVRVYIAISDVAAETTRALVKLFYYSNIQLGVLISRF